MRIILHVFMNGNRGVLCGARFRLGRMVRSIQSGAAQWCHVVAKSKDAKRARAERAASFDFALDATSAPDLKRTVFWGVGCNSILQARMTARWRSAMRRLIGGVYNRQAGYHLVEYGQSYWDGSCESMIELDWDATPVSRELARLGIEHKVLKHPGPLESLQQAAEERGQRPEQVVRSIVFRTASGEFIMVLVAGPAQISWPKLRAYLGQSRLTTATEEELVAVTGYTRGAVAPFALPAPIRILVDRGLLREDVVSMGSGAQGTTVILKTSDLLTALRGAEPGDFVVPGLLV